MELMNKEEIHIFGLEVLVQYLQNNDYKIIFVQPKKEQLPNVLAEKDDAVVFILASTDVYPNKGVVSDVDKAAALEHAKEFDAQVACAYLGIANAEGVEKNDKELCSKAYKNAGFVTDFSGLEYIQFQD